MGLCTSASSAVLLCLIVWVGLVTCSPPGFTHECYCDYLHPQTLLCKADIIAKVQLVGKPKLHEFSGYSPWAYEYYYYDDKGKMKYVRDAFEAKILKLYKKNKKLKTKTVNLLVFPVENFDYGCPPTKFRGAKGDTFVIGGKLTAEGIEIEGCDDFHEKFDDLTKAQKRLLNNKRYFSREACKCKICYEGEVVYRYGSYLRSYEDEYTSKKCTKRNTTCIYNMNEEMDKTPINEQGSRGFDFQGCHQGNAFCKYVKKDGTCRWKFHRLGKKYDRCENILNK